MCICIVFEPVIISTCIENYQVYLVSWLLAFQARRKDRLSFLNTTTESFFSYLLTFAKSLVQYTEFVLHLVQLLY